jgi:hypothetical protein
VLQALLGYVSEARWLRFVGGQLRHLFPYLSQQPGYNKRLRRLAPAMTWLDAALAHDTQWWPGQPSAIAGRPGCGRAGQFGAHAADLGDSAVTPQR